MNKKFGIKKTTKFEANGKLGGNKALIVVTVFLLIAGSFAILTVVSPDASATSALAVTVTSSQNPTDVGMSATLTASASGGVGTYTYLWYWANGTATNNKNDNFVLTKSTAGTYGMYVKVTDDGGSGVSVDSSTYDEVFNSLPSVSISASRTTVDVGQSFTLSSSVSGGTSPYTYAWFWYNNGTPISGATSSSYTASLSSSGTYYYGLHITDDVGSKATSNEVIITVNPALTVSISSSKNPIDYGQSVTFSSSVSGGTSPYTYQWMMDGANVSGATGSTWTTTTLPVGTDSIVLWVTDSAGDPRLSKPNYSLPDIVLTPNVLTPNREGNTIQNTVYIGDFFNISLADVGTMSMTLNSTFYPANASHSAYIYYPDYGYYTYQWYLNGTKIPGATEWYLNTHENYPGTYLFTLRLTSDTHKKGIYNGTWIGNWTEIVTSNKLPHNSVEFIESGLPNGSVWSAAFTVYSHNSTYQYGTTFTGVDGFYSTVEGNGIPTVIITPPNGTWTFYIDYYVKSASGPFVKSNNYIANITEGTLTFPADTSNGSVIVHVTFTLNTDLLSNSTNTTITDNSTLNNTLTNMTGSNSALNNTIGIGLKKNNTGNSTIVLPRKVGPPPYNPSLLIVAGLFVIALIFTLIAKQLDRRKRREKEAQDWMMI